MRGLDTNVLLRPLTQDDPSQASAVEAFFREVESRGERLFVSGIVLCETCWSLRGFGYSRSEIASTLEKLLDTALFEIQDRELVRRALAQYRQGPADFADYLIGWQCRQAGCADTVTFDQKLGRAPGFSLLTEGM
ncbi:MAG TPA: type II toxin-antitoxin system VapC family toxin [Thermoanaerobaculia bacterium]|nr:type II toxin-antitoxin system VapC family toxin [Thermoanaerobaculia bacterium]